MKNLILNNLVIAILVVISSPALAQESASTTTEGDAATAKPPQEESSSRFRWGISAGGGPIVGGYDGGAGGIDARFGVQLDQLLGFYAQPVALVGAGVSADADGGSAAGLAAVGVGALADVTLINLIYLALGPELLFGEFGAAEVNVNDAGASASAEAASGVFFSIASRAGIALGSMEPTGRSAFAIGLDMHIVFVGDVAVMPMIFLGYESF